MDKNSLKATHNFNILTEPWAITKDGLESIFYQLNRDNDIDSGMASTTDEKQNEVKLDIVNKIAIIPVQSSLYRSSYDTIRNKVEAAVNDLSVKAIVLKINSPGGLVSGCKELADFISDAGKKKHIYAYADGTMCSAAFWIGSAAIDIAAPVTASIGSIGVRTIHIDWSEWNEKAGLNFTHIAAGSYKTLGNEDEPLNKKAKEYFQSRLEALYTIFVDSVAANLGVDNKKALLMADGKVFLAGQALEKGLINRIEQDFESYFSLILQKEKIMDLKTLKADHLDIYSQVLEKGKAAATAENEQKIKEAVAAETKRVLGIVNAVAGDKMSKKLGKVVESGASAEIVSTLKDSLGLNQDDAEANQETASREKILKGLEEAHSKGVEQQTGKEKSGQKTLEDQAKEYSDLVNN
ncbi:MAG: S49 family peptidase [Deltaproteobacteria bacterium]|nr:S49 family peptidase [Deltaproteobacteria bacterium]